MNYIGFAATGGNISYATGWSKQMTQTHFAFAAG
jgi:hypothetical protein